ncbi:MAG: SAM-dependent chlorinase/fluorinase [Bacteroidales bacterium]|nr:SAM-dependent chlorinase/fluorinase [Bacteroidales bacterium]
MQRLVVIADWIRDNVYRSMFEGILISKYNDLQPIYFQTQQKYIYETALILRFCLLQYPPQTIIFVSNTSNNSNFNGYLYFYINEKHLFLPNNGLIGLCEDIVNKEKAFKITNENPTFPELTVYIPALIEIIEHSTIENAEPLSEYNKYTHLLPDVSNDKIFGTVIYIDCFGNIFINITRQLFEKYINSRRFVIYPSTKHLSIYKISESYDEIEEMKPFAIFNSLGLLEIGIKGASLSELYTLDYLSNIIIEIYDT